MVEVKSNLLTVAIIAGFALLLMFFANSFQTTTKEGSETVITIVNDTSDEIKVLLVNLTTAISDLTLLKSQELKTFREGFSNLSSVIDKEIKLDEMERNESKENIQTFLDAFERQNQQTRDVIVDLNRDSNASRAQQTEAFIETLGLSQNLTRESQELTRERNQIEENQTEKIDDLVQAINLTLTFPSNKTIQ